LTGGGGPFKDTFASQGRKDGKKDTNNVGRKGKKKLSGKKGGGKTGISRKKKPYEKEMESVLSNNHATIDRGTSWCRRGHLLTAWQFARGFVHSNANVPGKT